MVDGLGWVLCVATKGAGTLQEQPATRRGRRVEGGEGGGGEWKVPSDSEREWARPTFEGEPSKGVGG
jgi:hypothetical protein